ncbi:MAG: sulfatase-like hydrolase/transferase [Deltaproteobacteria bacterium]|nr:sulfatase-like hydrolase/transferase [Deltaproteobacteria bacterium]
MTTPSNPAPEVALGRDDATARARRFGLYTFLVVLTGAAAAKTVIVFDEAVQGAAPGLLRWLPVTLAGELLLAGLLGVAAARAARIVVAGRSLGPIALGVGLITSLWMAANVLSYRLDQTPLTWWRLSGGEGGGVGDVTALVEPRDMVPALGVGALALACLWPLAKLAKVPRGRWLHAPGAALVLGLIAHPVERAWLSAYDRGLGEQPVFIFLTSLFDDDEEAAPVGPPTPQGWHELERAHLWTDEMKAPPPSVPGATVKNVLLFYAEGVPREMTTLGDPERDTTPLLAARAQHGVELTRYHATFHKSIAAIYSLVCSDWPPPDASNITELNPRIDCGELSEVMASHGVKSAVFHGGPFGFYDKLALLGGRRYDTLLDAKAIAVGNDQIFQHAWGIDDRAVVDETLRWIDGLDRDERFAAMVIPIAAHYPYSLPPDVPHATKNARSERFLSAVRYVDLVFDGLMQGLERRGLLDETLVMFVADHGAPFSAATHTARGARLAYEKNLSVPAVLFSPKLFPQGARFGRPASHLDLLPTMLDALGFAADPRHRGQSLLDAAVEPRRIYIGALSAPLMQVGFLDGDHKLLTQRGGRGLELYDLASDPFEQHNLLGALPDEAARGRADAQRFYQWQLERLRSAPTLGDEVDMPAALLAAAQLEPVGTSWTLVTAIASGEERRCLVFEVPPRARVTMTLRDQPRLFPFLTQAWFGYLDENNARPEVRVLATTDSVRSGRGALDVDHEFARVNYRVPTERLAIAFDNLGDAAARLCLALDDRSWAGTFDTDQVPGGN